MKSFFNIYILLYLTFSIQCSSQEDSKTTKKVEIDKLNKNEINITMKTDSTEIYKHLKLQENIETDEYEPERPYELTEKDFNIAKSILNEYLKNNGFKTDRVKFENRVNEIFQKCHVTEYNSKLSILNVNPHFKDSPFDLFFYTGHYFFDSQIGLMLRMYTLHELIPYPNESPVHSPNKISFNKDLVLNINLYLFNDDKSRLPWLLKNDEYFMKSLVLTFGWTEDEKLLKWVIENNKFDKNNPLEFGKMFYTKRCDGSLKLQSNTFKYLQKTITPENQGILDDIKLFVKYFADDKNKIDNLSEKERIEILSNIVYFAEQFKYEEGYRNRRIMAWMYFNIGQRDREELLKQNNYFNLPKFKQWWETVYNDGDFSDVTDINDGVLDDY